MRSAAAVSSDDLDATEESRRHRSSQTRREKILWSALRLFRDKGFTAVSIDEIGEAAGIAGPSVYRHFASKEEILAAGFELGDKQIFASAEEALRGARTSRDALKRLTASYVDRASENADLVAVFMTESRALPHERELAVRREQRRYVGRWVEVLREVRPRLSKQEARALVQGAIGIVNAGVQRSGDVSPTVARATLRAMATGALLRA
jgi:AcrR family transcriptional regulator